MLVLIDAVGRFVSFFLVCCPFFTLVSLGVYVPYVTCVLCFVDAKHDPLSQSVFFFLFSKDHGGLRTYSE